MSAHNAIQALVWVLIGACIYFVLNWGLTKVCSTVKEPEPFKTIGTVIIVIFTCAAILNGLLWIVGHPFIAW